MSEHAMTTPPGSAAIPRRQHVVVAVVYVAVMFMAVMDTTIVNVALPTIARDDHLRPDEVGMVSIAYLVSLTVFIPASGWWGDRVGGRRALLAAVGIFTVASALCGVSSNLDELVVFRAIQGAGGAVMTPVGLAMLFRVYPPAERVQISSILAVFTALAPALGPVLGGLLTCYFSWRLVFLVNVPIGLAVFAFGAARLAGHIPAHPGRLDALSLVLSGAGLGSAIYAISEAPFLGWFSPPILTAMMLGIGLLAAMVIVELRAPNPLLDLRLFRNRLFASASGVYALGSAAYLGALFLAALFFQTALGLSAVQSGLISLPSALGVMAGGQMVTRLLYPRIGPRRIAATGLSLVAIMMISMARMRLGAGPEQLAGVMFGLGLGVSFAFISAQAACMATIEQQQIGRAASLFNAGKQLGGAIGVAMISTILAADRPGGPGASHAGPGVTACHAGFFAGGVAAIIGVGVAMTIRDSDAVATMTRRIPGRAMRKGRSSV